MDKIIETRMDTKAIGFNANIEGEEGAQCGRDTETCASPGLR